MFFRTNKQIYDFVAREMSRIEDEMRILDPKSDEYAILQKRYFELLSIRNQSKGTVTLGYVKTAAELGITAFASVVVPLTLAKISYSNDQNMSLCNGRIWNLIGRNTKTKI